MTIVRPYVGKTMRQKRAGILSSFVFSFKWAFREACFLFKGGFVALKIRENKNMSHHESA